MRFIEISKIKLAALFELLDIFFNVFNTRYQLCKPTGAMQLVETYQQQ